MSREKKAEIIDQLEELFSRSEVGILTDYRGLSTVEITALRRKLGESGIDYRVVKNTLARFAMERSGREVLAGLFEGPVAVVSGHGNITEPAKVLTEYIRTSKIGLSIRGGFLGDRLLSAEDVTALATLPSKEILLAKIMGGMQSPIYGLLNCVTAPLRGLMMVLQARIQQLEGE